MNMQSPKTLSIIGGGLAGSEAAWQAAQRGFKVNLYEMRPQSMMGAHQSGNLAELVCSNSFRSNDDQSNAVGLLHWELNKAQSLIIKTAYAHKVPSGSSLAVDRDGFAEAIT